MLAQGHIWQPLRRIMMNSGDVINLQQVYASQAVCVCVPCVKLHFPWSQVVTRQHKVRKKGQRALWACIPSGGKQEKRTHMHEITKNC